MDNLRQMQIMGRLLQILTEKIGERTSIGFATISISKAILDLRNKHDCFNYILINETRYTEGLNALTVSEEINAVDSYEFYSAIKGLIERTMVGFDDNMDIGFINELRKILPDIFYVLDNLDKEKIDKTKQEIMIIGDNTDLIETLINGFKEISSGYEITGANSGVKCFDLLAGGYKPKLIVLDTMMSDMKGKDIFNRLKNSSTWKNIPVVLLAEKTDSSSNDFSELSAQDYVTKPFEITDLKNRIDNVLKETKK